MKITYLALSENYGEPHAGFVHTKSICEGLASIGNEVTLIIGKRKTKNIIKTNKVKVIEIKTQRIQDIIKSPINAINEIRKINKIINKSDIIHERYSVNPLSLIIKNKKIKNILEVNDPGIETWTGFKRILFTPIIKLKLSKCNAIITQTETLATILKKQTKKPIFVISNGVNFERFSEISKQQIKEKRKKLGIKENELVIGFISSFREWHFDKELIELAEEFIKRKPKTKFLLIGDGKILPEIKKQVKEKKLENKFIFTGKIKYEEVPLMINCFDIAIAPFSTTDFPQLKKHGFWWNPVKLYEYMAAGKPITSFNYTEVKKIVQETGILVNPGNFMKFFDALIKLVENPKLRKELSQLSRKTAINNSWENKAKETIKVYKKV